MQNTQTNSIPPEQNYLNSLKDFFIAGLSFRETVLAIEEQPNEAFVSLLHLLPVLYQKGLALPRTLAQVGLEDCFEEETILSEYVTEEEYTAIEKKIETILGTSNFFLDTFGEEMRFTDAPITQKISEHLADIYQPVSNLLLTAKNRDFISLPYAVLHCSGLFQEYWGDRVLAVLRALHHLYCMRDSHQEKLEESEFSPMQSLLQQRIESFFND